MRKIASWVADKKMCYLTLLNYLNGEKILSIAQMSNRWWRNQRSSRNLIKLEFVATLIGKVTDTIGLGQYLQIAHWEFSVQCLPVLDLRFSVFEC